MILSLSSRHSFLLQEDKKDSSKTSSCVEAENTLYILCINVFFNVILLLLLMLRSFLCLLMLLTVLLFSIYWLFSGEFQANFSCPSKEGCFEERERAIQLPHCFWYFGHPWGKETDSSRCCSGCVCSWSWITEKKKNHSESREVHEDTRERGREREKRVKHTQDGKEMQNLEEGNFFSSLIFLTDSHSYTQDRKERKEREEGQQRKRERETGLCPKFPASYLDCLPQNSCEERDRGE